ncbi:hypothetical protein ABT354_21875 [Streptomyces sp. NPDC000594]|uniref:hypothetical protein n=1 Tax=Streptomyces sp. NPDC000594 TaxID=3154261 RepID=UPI00331CCF41
MSDSENGFACKAGADDFSARAYRSGEGRRSVAVKGVCSCNTEGFRLTLELAAPPLVPVPEELHLNLVETAPTDPVVQVITETEVEEATFDIGDEVVRVLIRNRGFSVPVTEG